MADTDEAKAIARDVYIYAYPMVLMDVSGKVSTNVAVRRNVRNPRLCDILKVRFSARSC
jgi:hypothetical protein